MRMKKKYRKYLTAVVLAMGIFTSGCGAKEETFVAAETSAPVEQKETSEKETTQKAENKAEAEEETPVYGKELKDGTYSISVDSSSDKFRVTACDLTVSDGKMTAVMTMGGTGYLKVYMGTGEEALKAGEEDFIPFQETKDGLHTFQVPVEALDKKVDCAAFSKRKETWYDRVLVFKSDLLPAEAFLERKEITGETLKLEDGAYLVEVKLEGGSGRASVKSPARIQVKDGQIWAEIEWGSSNYDYMKVDGVKYELLDTEGNSNFEIPVAAFDRKIPVIADTIAMSEPHEIEYTLIFDSSTLKKLEEGTAVSWTDLQSRGSMPLLYAQQFSVEYLEEDYRLIKVKEGGTYLTVPENMPVPLNVPKEVTVLRQPLDHIYLAATSAMDLFRNLDCLDRITLSGTDASGWYIKEAREAVESGKIKYAGKYNAPDYELILSDGCDLAVESTMIHHAPEIQEKLETLGIPVFVERSSYESHPLGRMEWIRLYGTLLGEEKAAEESFLRQAEKLETLEKEKPLGKTVAFFYINSNGGVNVRKTGDYVARMIKMAGGTYVPSDLSESENALSTMNMQMEAFYGAARDADYLIYNSTIDGELKSLDELLKKSSLLADFKAVKEGNVWCTGKNLFQESMGLGDMILDIHRMLTEENPDPADMVYLHKLS